MIQKVDYILLIIRGSNIFKDIFDTATFNDSHTVCRAQYILFFHDLLIDFKNNMIFPFSILIKFDKCDAQYGTDC